jgi:hypothetical protein
MVPVLYMFSGKQQRLRHRAPNRSRIVCNANRAREEVVLNFGVNKSWERNPQQEGLEIELNLWIVLSPFAAKRLSALLRQRMKGYEARYGALSE